MGVACAGEEIVLFWMIKCFLTFFCQSRRSAGISSVDTDNCFDRVALAVASLIFQAFGVTEGLCAAMLKTIRDMQIFLRTAFGDSKSAAGIRIKIKTQGLCQGNGATPAG